MRVGPLTLLQNIETARQYARRRAIRARTLFGNVYHVRPLSPEPQVNDYSDGAGFVEVADPKGHGDPCPCGFPDQP